MAASGRVEYFSIGGSVKDQPDRNCSLCRVPMKKTILPFVEKIGSLTLKDMSAPGYKCGECGFRSRTLETEAAIIIRALPLLDPKEHISRIAGWSKILGTEIMPALVNSRNSGQQPTWSYLF